MERNRFINVTSFTFPPSVVYNEFGLSPIVTAVTAVVVFILGVKIVRVVFNDVRGPIKEATKTHNWKNTTSFQGVLYFISFFFFLLI